MIHDTGASIKKEKITYDKWRGDPYFGQGYAFLNQARFIEWNRDELPDLADMFLIPRKMATSPRESLKKDLEPILMVFRPNKKVEECYLTHVSFLNTPELQQQAYLTEVVSNFIDSVQFEDFCDGMHL